LENWASYYDYDYDYDYYYLSAAENWAAARGIPIEYLLGPCAAQAQKYHRERFGPLAMPSLPPPPGQARALTSEQKADLRVVYSAMDRDSDGCVTAKEMLECLRTVQASYSIESVEALMAEVDLKTRGQVTWDEFVLVMEKKLSETTSEAQLFELLDENGNGTINPAELKASLLRYGLDASDQILDEMIRAVDLDGDGVIALTEFKAALQS
jgi:calmodulin